MADVYWYFKQWEQAKVTEVMLAALRSRPGCSRAAIPSPAPGSSTRKASRARTPSDATAVVTTPARDQRQEAVHRHGALGLLIAVVVLAASVQDRDGARTTLLSAYLEERPVSLRGH